MARPAEKARRITGALVEVALAVGLVLGCGAHRPDVGPDALRVRRADFVRVSNEEYDANLRVMLQRMEQEVKAAGPGGSPRFDVLALHGGGPAGAFAAGFLTGWGDVSDPKWRRPTFDVVTGSSSGALIAPYAFIGDDDSYARVLELFCEFPTDIFYSPGFFALWPTRSALLDPARLEKLIGAEMGEEIMERIALGADANRTLLAATTDLDVGLGRIWDLSVESQKGRVSGDRKRFQDILLASTALPIIFPPVEIDGSLHSDGGIAGSLFIGFGTNGIERIAETWHDHHPDTSMPALHFWAIVNQQLFAKSQTTRPRYMDVGARSIEIAMEYDRLKVLLLLSNTVERLDRHDHIEATFHWVAIPTSATLPQSIENFNDQEVIRSLTEIGAQMGANPANWRGSELSAEWLPTEVDALDPHSKGTPRAYCPARSS